MTPRIIGVSVGVGLLSFLVTESMHQLLVPDLGRHWERLLAEGASALVVAALAAGLGRMLPISGRKPRSSECRSSLK